MGEIQLSINLDDVICPICLDFPHNAVLLKCTSYGKGCRSFVCDTNHLHSNCLVRFIQANGMSISSMENLKSLYPADYDQPVCPLCRGKVYDYIVCDKARMHLDEKKRCCEEDKCGFSGTYMELQKHAHVEHPHACPSKIDPARQLDWENFQQSSEIVDVLSTIHSEIPHGVVLGDYVIEHGGYSSGDDFDNLPVDHRNWWRSCILYQVFDNIRTSRNRRRSRNGNNNSSRGRNIPPRYDHPSANSERGTLASYENTLRAEDAYYEFIASSRLAVNRDGNFDRQRGRRPPSPGAYHNN
ncbi:hypothetical protein M569_02615 [Genlisea aurea]|uniref:Uncharacterized protein n=1 Tax=Genlisea aurea TaxID=192259 RepID=S8E8G0_9LAMI|nr:hypothetical protein M569_02615 [Genlisea aurea]